ncbi:MAG: hypothetical protein NC124_17290 [Clostridium sp.]|nr:hypothetical protein [Clostridium sp.]
MKRNEEKFFKHLQKKAKKNPVEKSKAAAEYITNLIKKACTDANGINGNKWTYMLSMLTGIACSKAANAFVAEEIEALLNGGGGIGTGAAALTKLETEAGDFYIGEALDQCLFLAPYSVWNMSIPIIRQQNPGISIPDIEALVAANAKVMGDKTYRIWDSTFNPYEEIRNARGTFETIGKQLEPYQLNARETMLSYTMSLTYALVSMAGIFPKGKNCVEMAMETVVFIAHMG